VKFEKSVLLFPAMLALFKFGFLWLILLLF